VVTDGTIGYVIQRAAGRGYALTQVRTAVLRIGRGTNAELRSENPAVALEHATIESDSAGYAITDRGSITGTYVNRKPVETARLAKGDVVEIGDLRIEVQLAEPGKPLFLRVIATVPAAKSTAVEDDEDEQVAAATPGAKVVRAKKVDYAGAYRLRRSWLTKLSVTAILLILALAVTGELLRPQRHKAFMPGGLSSAHARFTNVAENCSSCHTPWNSVVNAKCLDCHPQVPHAANELKSPDCFTCHAEHRGMTRLAMIPDSTCTDCHADLQKHVRRGAESGSPKYPFAAVAAIRSFGDGHPELVLPDDPNTLRFNHKLHLGAKGIFNAQGRREVLQCTACHAASRGTPRNPEELRGTEPAPVDFEQHCQRCHLLTFDPRFPTDQAPHGGDPQLVYGAVVAAYTGNRDILGRPPAEQRRLLAARRLTAPDERILINANQVFKTKCKQCHDIMETRGTRLAVKLPTIRRDWLPGARFSHGKHRLVACEDCHRGARASTATGDVLMPRLADCTKCHAGGSAQAASSCRTCHGYHLHPSKQTNMASLAPAARGELGRGGRMFQGMLLAGIVILLLVVLVPVGLALYQRLRPAAPERPAAAPRPAPPPPMPDQLTTKVPAITIPPVAPPVAPPVPSPDVTAFDATIARPDRPTAGGVDGGTEMMQWNGLLVCTAGPLEGQRFIIEDEGFYIGRDSTLSKVVVADSRVSKRHVRIIPRNGKVMAIDQGSTNGTFLGAPGGERITEVQLKRGDQLVLADNAAVFLYQI
jgi:pSer/pThr/pTyr-binding forkhead associated (FHA) protein